MRARSLALLLAGVAGLLTVPLPAQAVPTCPDGAICIDESVEGAIPTITAPTGFSTSINPISGLLAGVGEEWTITVTPPTTFFVNVTQSTVGLLEPNSGSLSDLLQPTLPVFGIYTYILYSDNELGQIGTTCSVPTCTSFTQDGTFQQLPNNNFVIGSFPSVTVNLYLRSDLDGTSVPVPEPASLILFGTALAGFAVMRRRRRRAS